MADTSSSESDSDSSDSYQSDSTEFDLSDADSSPSKRLKSGTDDRISALPDSILHHILCFIDTKQVVKTCKLSRRWRSVWKFVPTLNFNFVVGDKLERFVKFVDRVFLLRNDEVNIDSLCFSCSKISYDDLENWMTVAQRKHVQELNLDLSSNQSNATLPGFIFTSEIKVFKLRSERCRARVPRLMCSSPYLKTIELLSVTLPYSNNVDKKLVITCPVLEELRLINCRHYKLEKLHVSAPQLRNLVIEKTRSYDMTPCKIQLSTMSLVSLVLKGSRMYNSYSLGSLPSLVNAMFELSVDEWGSGIFYEVLNAVCNVRDLEVSCRPLRTSKNPKMLDQFLKQFLNLRRLKLSGSSDGSYIHPIHNLLASSISLETLSLGINQISMDRDWMELSHCISRLKFIGIEGIEGREVELEFFKFVLETAVSLEVFNATPHEKFLWKTKKERATFTMSIYSLPRASPNVQVIFFR